MNNEHDIDKLLKESFENFSPDAPNVWQAVQQGVQAAQASATASSGVAGAVVQGVGLGVKIIAGMAIAAASITGYIVFNNQSPQEPVQTNNAIVKNEVVVPQAQTLPETNETKTTESITSGAPENNTSTRKNTSQHSTPQVVVPAATTEKPVDVLVQSQETAVVSAPVSKTDVSANTGAIVPETKPAVDQTKAAQTGVKEEPKQEVATSKKTTAPPYNPRAEEGEVYEKPTIPGSFSPNNDGLNDRFVIVIDNEVYFSLRILNDKGETVFESKSSAQTWDGKHYKTGAQCSGGTYIYVLSYQYKGSEKPHEESGILKLF